MDNQLLEFKLKSSRRLNAILLLLIFLLLVASGYLGYQIYKLNQKLETGDFKAVTPSATQSNLSLSNETTQTLSTPEEESRTFIIDLKLKNAQQPPVGLTAESKFNSLADYLASLVEVDQQIRVFYNPLTTNPYPRGEETNLFNSSFYLALTKAEELKTNYQDDFLSAEVKPVTGLYTYLMKNDYCEEDADCMIGASMCTHGVFNHYREYQDPPWGCGPPGYKDGYRWGTYSDQLDCYTELKFDGARCFKNTCVPVKREVVCTDAQTPAP